MELLLEPSLHFLNRKNEKKGEKEERKVEEKEIQPFLDLFLDPPLSIKIVMCQY
jgi:hypothetical protein